MSTPTLISYLQNTNNLEETGEKNFVCVVDNVVVGNITSLKMQAVNGEVVPVVFPDWKTFLKILQSPNHAFIERPIRIFPGTIWNGTEFIAPSEPEVARNETTNGIYLKVNNSCIYYELEWMPIKDYTMYTVGLLREYLERNPSLELNVVVVISPKKTISFDNNNKTVYIYLNLEQTIIDDTAITLVKEPETKVAFNDKQYTVNMEMFNDFKDNDIIFDYSKPNIKNIEISGLYPDFLPKLQYVSACVYKNVNAAQLTKTIDTLTLFADISISARREQKLQEINALLVNHRNETNCFEEELKTLLGNTKILINIHNSDYANTFEEVRVLPALQQKVLVVSEVSPLTELIPFGPMIIWSTYDNIVQKAKEVLDNYDTYYSQIFTEQNINMLNGLHAQNSVNIGNKLNAFLQG
jgi:hypothetical protein